MYQDIRFIKEPKIRSTQKQRGLMEFLIEKSSNVGDVVADFYGGSYAVPRGAIRTFRKSIGVELNLKIHDAGKDLLKHDYML